MAEWKLDKKCTFEMMVAHWTGNRLPVAVSHTQETSLREGATEGFFIS